MHAKDQTPERIAIRFHVQGAGCELDPLGRGHLWFGSSRRLEAHWKGGDEHVEQITQLRLLLFPAD